MAEEETKQSQADLQETPPPVPVPVTSNKVDTPVYTEPNTQSKKGNTEGIQTKPTLEAKKVWGVPEKIALGGLFVNIIMIVATYLLFKEAQLQTKNASLAIEKASEANKISKDNYNLARDIFEDGKRSDEEKNKLNKQALQAQIGAWQDEKVNFQRLNEPYLQIKEIELGQVLPNQKFDIICTIANLKETPVKVISIITATQFKVIPIDFSSKEKYAFIDSVGDIVNEYVIKNNDITRKTTVGKIDADLCDRIVRGNYYVYYYLLVKYQNLITKKYRMYKTQFKLKPLDGYTFREAVYNENFDLE